MIPLDDPMFWLLGGVGVILTGISKSGMAGGAGVVAVPLLALILPVPVAAALMLPLLLVMDINTLALYRRALNGFSLLWPICASALLGVALAGAALGRLDSDSLQVLLGVLCLAFAGWQRLAPMLGKLPGAAWLWGTLAGITSTLLHAGGPPISIYFLSKNLPKTQWLALAAVFFAVVNVTKLIPYSLNGVWSTSLLLGSLALLPFSFMGVWLGKQLQQRVSQAGFLLMIRLLLAISGLILLVK